MNAPALPPFAALPPFVRPLANVIGVPATLRLAEAANGRPVYVPQRLTPAARLVRLVGLEIARRLHQHYAGELLTLPTAAQLAALSPDSIAAMRHAVTTGGVSIRTLAAVTGLSAQCIRATIGQVTEEAV